MPCSTELSILFEDSPGLVMVTSRVTRINLDLTSGTVVLRYLICRLNLIMNILIRKASFAHDLSK